MRLSRPPSLRPEDYSFSHRVRVRFAETDAMGIVHHTSYILYMEEARVAFMRHLGHPYAEMRAEGIDAAVTEVSVRYRQPLRFDDEVDVHVALTGARAATFQLAYLMIAAGEVRATAASAHGAVGPDGRPTRLPAWLARQAARASISA